MKRFFLILAVAVTAITACTKSELAPSAAKVDNQISFMPANYASTKVDGPTFPTDEAFSTYAWTAGTAGTYFMDNVTIKYDASDDRWKPVTTYYWPGYNQGVDFFSYYPSGMSGLSVAANQIAYSNIDFAKTQVDIMYADKAVAYTQNAHGEVGGRDGVPTFFRHAAAKVMFKAVLGTATKTETDGSVTRWEIKLKGVNLTGVYTKGDCTMPLASTPTTGQVQWTKPTDANGYNVWTKDTGATVNSDIDTKYNNSNHYDMVSGEAIDVIPAFYVLPQTLVADQQKVTIVFDVKTYRKLVGETAETLVLTQTDQVASADLLTTTIPAWEMSHFITYTITINPTGSFDPKPIYFDPAVDNWVAETATTAINLNL